MFYCIIAILAFFFFGAIGVWIAVISANYSVSFMMGLASVFGMIISGIACLFSIWVAVTEIKSYIFRRRNR